MLKHTIMNDLVRYYSQLNPIFSNLIFFQNEVQLKNIMDFKFYNKLNTINEVNNLEIL